MKSDVTIIRSIRFHRDRKDVGMAVVINVHKQAYHYTEPYIVTHNHPCVSS